MLYTIVNLNDIFYNENDNIRRIAERSSNPFDYIRAGWYLDHSALFEGVNNVSLNSDYSGRISGNNFHISNK